ncbi:MAG: DUF368 domain-containing protein [Bacilli bacterium]|nr:DUF368 domain-containing protein [Bacilli bacterium]
MNSIIIIIKGFIIGIGKIIPGVSGSLIAISLGLYEQMIISVNNLFSNFKKNFTFLFKISIGILLAMVLFSKLIDYFLKNNYLYTMAIIIGLIIGIIPNIVKKIKSKNSIFCVIIILLLISFIIKDINVSLNFILNIPFFKYIYITILGFIDAITMIVPGISGTAIFMMIDSYNFILNMYINFEIINLSFFFLGVVLGVFIISSLISKMLDNHKNLFYQIILLLSSYSILMLLKSVVTYLNRNNFVITLFLILLGFFIAKKLDNM